MTSLRNAAHPARPPGRVGCARSGTPGEAAVPTAAIE